jgi:O-antigen/teichoic acid export membrane protein
MPATALITPLWVYYRKMEFLKQRKLALWDPLTAFVVTVTLAVMGFGYWSLVLGTLAGQWAAAIVAVRTSPYKLRFYYEPGTIKEYASFSWPLMLSQASGVMIAQVPILFVQRNLGVAAVGAITLAGTISLYANRVDDIITQTLYPAIARVKDKPEVLLETFTKSNRLALLWGVPVGVGIALFARDIVDYLLGDKWMFAVPIIQILAVTSGLNQFGFNWGAFFKALGRTRPFAVTGVFTLVAVLALAVPLTLTEGLKGYAWGMAGATALQMGLRCWYLSRIFPAFDILSHAFRALLPTVPAAGLVVLMRALESGPRTELMAALEATVFVVVLAVGTLLMERDLIREILGYLRAKSSAEPAPAGNLAPQ